MPVSAGLCDHGTVNIAVLCGGESAERDVSLSSGAGISLALERRGHDVTLVDPAATEPILPVDVPAKIPDTVPETDESAILRERIYHRLTSGPVSQTIREADVAFLAFHGGWGEDGHVQALLEMAQIPFTGAGSVPCATAWRKDHSLAILRDADIPTAENTTFRYGQEPEGQTIDALLRNGPIIAKPVAEGSSVGVTLTSSRHEVLELMAGLGPGDELLIERFLAGREFTVGVLGTKALPVTEIEVTTGQIFDYQAKYQPDAAKEICPADITASLQATLQELAVNAHNRLGFSGAYSRVDFRCDDGGRPYCLELNALPGLTPVSLLPLAAHHDGMDYENLVEGIIRLALPGY